METSSARVVLFTREGCHLCEAARALVAEEAERVGATWTEIDVATDPAAEAAHGDLVPVVVIDGVRRGILRLDRTRVRRALEATPRP